jgi:hypothetical protein
MTNKRLPSVLLTAVIGLRAGPAPLTLASSGLKAENDAIIKGQWKGGLLPKSPVDNATQKQVIYLQVV